MVGLIRSRLYESPEIDALGLDSLRSSAGDVIDATAAKAWDENPTVLLDRALRRSKHDETYTNEFGIEVPNEFYEPSPTLSADEANARFGITDKAGKVHLKWDSPVKEGLARELHDLKRTELLREDTLNRSPGGFGLGVAQFGVGLAVTAIDPINVASAFVPVVGPAKYAALIGKAASPLAKFGIRAGVGAAEGAVGAALVESIVYPLAQSEQRDYDAVDSLMNIGFGVTLGGGLRSFGGLLGDRIFKQVQNISPETHVAAMRSGIAQIVDGRPVDIEAVYRASLLESTYLTSRRADVPPHVFGVADPIDRSFKPTADLKYALVDTVNVDPVVRIGLGTKRDGAVPVHSTREAAEKAAAKIARKDGVQTDVVETSEGFVVRQTIEAQPVRRPDGSVLAFESERAANKFVDRTPAARGRDLAVVPYRADGKPAFAVIENATEAEIRSISARPDAVDFGRGPDNSAGNSLEHSRLLQDQLKARAASSLDRVIKEQMDQIRGVAPEFQQAIANVKARVAAAPSTRTDAESLPVLERELADLENDIANLLKVGDISEAEAKHIAEADLDIEAAQKAARQYELVAACILGNP